MKYRVMELLISPSAKKPLKLEVLFEKKIDYPKLKLIRNPMCTTFCYLNNIKLPTKKRIDCKSCYKREIVSGVLTDDKNVYPIINGIPRILPINMQSMLFDYHEEFFKKYKDKLTNFNYNKKKTTWGDNKKIKRTLQSYSYQWQTFDEMLPSWGKFFEYHLYPFKLPFFKNKKVVEAGCGYGRCLYQAAVNGAEAFGFDLSEAVQSAYKNTSKLPHAHIVQASIYDIPFKKDFDFVYSMGVIQHTPKKDLSFKRLADITKKGTPLHIWVYGKRKWHYKIVYFLRFFTTRMPYRTLHALCYVLAIVQYTLLGIPYKILKGLGMGKLAKKIPYTVIAEYPFRYNHVNWFDRLSVPVTDEFSEKRVHNWFKKAGFKDVQIIPTPKVMGIRAYGIKK